MERPRLRHRPPYARRSPGRTAPCHQSRAVPAAALPLSKRWSSYIRDKNPTLSFRPRSSGIARRQCGGPRYALQSVCDFIRSHATEKLSLTGLAAKNPAQSLSFPPHLQGPSRRHADAVRRVLPPASAEVRFARGVRSRMRFTKRDSGRAAASMSGAIATSV